MSGLAKLKRPLKRDGATATWNSSQVSDGAAAVLLMKRSIAMQKGLPILGVFSQASPGPKKIMGVFSKANEYAEMNYNFLGCAENALGIREWLESKGHQYIVTPEKEGPYCGYSGDVWYPQPAPKDHLWRYMPNQAMTPHILGLPLMHKFQFCS